MGRPALRKNAVTYMTSHHGISQGRACRLIRQPRSRQYYQSRKDPRSALRQRMREIAHTRVRYGYRRVHILLKREGPPRLNLARHDGTAPAPAIDVALGASNAQAEACWSNASGSISVDLPGLRERVPP